MTRKYIIVADDSIKGFDEEIAKIEREWGAEEIEPCEDCISREAVINTIFYKADNNSDVVLSTDLMDRIKHLPSVTPKQKVGKWILKHRKHNSMKWLTGTDEYGVEHTVKKYEEYECDEPYCSECGKLAGDTSQNYCSNCGATMEVEE